MLGGQLRQLPGCRAPRPTGSQRVAPAISSSRYSRGALQVVAADQFNKFFDKLKGGGDDKGAGKGSGKGGDADAARRALQDTFGGKSNEKKYQNFFGTEAAGGGGQGGFGGFGGGGGGGGGGGSSTGPDEGGGGSSGRPIMDEVIEAFKYAWTVFWNTVCFLLFADVLHRSLDWCCSVELLFLVGAPQQAFERLAGRFFAVVEWVEKNMLGWDIPGDEDMIPQFENIKLFYPRAHAYTFDQYRYNLTDKEKDTLINAYALRHYEREDGHVGDVDPADIAAIKARHDPMEADRKAYQYAKATNTVEDYWATRKDVYERVTGKRFVRPPGSAPPPAPA